VFVAVVLLFPMHWAILIAAFSFALATCCESASHAN